MRLKTFEHLEPTTLPEACLLLSEHGAKAAVTAGGTDILVRMKYGVKQPDVLVNLKKVSGLNNIVTVDDTVRIGALVTLADIHRSGIIRQHCPILAEAALAVGAAQLQNMGTIGGNICLEPRCWYFQQGPSWRKARPDCFKNGGSVCYMAKGSRRCYALYSGDTAAALLALGAQVRLVSSGGERTIPLEEFFIDDGMHHTDLRPGELLAEVILPKGAEGQRGTYLKYRKRGAVDFPIVGVAATISGQAGMPPLVRIAVTGAGSLPFLIAIPPGIIPGNPLTGVMIAHLAEAARKQAKPVSRMEVSPHHRKQLVGVLVRDALEKLLASTL